MGDEAVVKLSIVQDRYRTPELLVVATVGGICARRRRVLFRGADSVCDAWNAVFDVVLEQQQSGNAVVIELAVGRDEVERGTVEAVARIVAHELKAEMVTDGDPGTGRQLAFVGIGDL